MMLNMNLERVDSILSSRSQVMILNRIGPSADPWETSLVSGPQLDAAHSPLLSGPSLNQQTVHLSKPWAAIFSRKIPWDMVLKALLNSR